MVLQLHRPSPRLLRPWLAVLALMAAALATRAVLLPPWPRVAELPTASIGQQLRRAGLAPRPLARRPASRTFDEARSGTVVWQLAGGLELAVFQATVRQRWSLSVGSLTQHLPALRMGEPKLVALTPGAQIGAIQGRPAIQTCLVPQPDQAPVPGVTLRQLTHAVDRAAREQQHPLSSWLGLRPKRTYACVLVSLRTAGSGTPVPVDLWPRLLRAVAAALPSSS